MKRIKVYLLRWLTKNWVDALQAEYDALFDILISDPKHIHTAQILARRRDLAMQLHLLTLLRDEY
jgi:hypothetical protein